MESAQTLTSSATPIRLLGVVLCGGRSSRMGRDKATLPHPQGGTFLAHAIHRLQNVCDAVAVSGTCSLAHCETIIADSQPHLGPAIGIAAALHHAAQHGFAACLITPVDVPALDAAALQSLKSTWQTTGHITIAHTDRLQPLIGVYPIDLADAIAELANSDDRSLMRWLQQCDIQSVSLSPRVCRNVNTPQDLDYDDPTTSLL